MSLFDGDDDEVNKSLASEDLGRELSVIEIADLLRLPGNYEARRKRARYWLHRLGIARQHCPGGKIYTTLGDLRALAPHVWLAASMDGG